MKMYTNSEQTAKLIELGFAHPKLVSNLVIDKSHFKPNFNYSIGELIEMLPKKLDTATDDTAYLEISWDNIGWRVEYVYFGFFLYTSMAIELIDALYAMIIKLKEEGVI